MPAATNNEVRSLKPGRFTRRVFNPFVAWLARRGISIRGSRQLAVRGRTSGEWRTTPVNPMAFEGERYLVAPRGNVQWVRNIRVSGGGELRLGRTTESFTITELPDDVKAPLLREYVRRWKAEVGQFFETIDANSTDEELLAIAPGFPVFRIAG